MMREQIESALADLLNLPLEGTGRAADMQVFEFGAPHTYEIRSGTITAGVCSLHIQCAWRISGPQGIIVASRDRHYPAGDPYNEPPDFDPSGSEVNRRDVRLQHFLAEHQDSLLTVELVAADPLGGFRLTLSEGFALEVFPDNSLTSEHWRLLTRLKDGRHFVVTGEGIEEP